MKIYVIGTGTMAKGIVKAFAAKMPVVMKSRTQASLDKAMASISKSYAKLVEKGSFPEMGYLKAKFAGRTEKAVILSRPEIHIVNSRDFAGNTADNGQMLTGC